MDLPRCHTPGLSQLCSATSDPTLRKESNLAESNKLMLRSVRTGSPRRREPEKSFSSLRFDTERPIRQKNPLKVRRLKYNHGMFAGSVLKLLGLKYEASTLSKILFSFYERSTNVQIKIYSQEEEELSTQGQIPALGLKYFNFR